MRKCRLCMPECFFLIKDFLVRNDDTSFGDLARDYRSACQIDVLNGREIEPLNKEHLCKWNATLGAHNALKKAINQYEKENNP